MIPYLSDFWSLASEASQDIGNAVAGALGNIFLYPLHLLVDLVLVFTYLIEQLLAILSVIFAPFYYIFAFLGGVITGALNPPADQNLFAPLITINELASMIPGIPILMTVLLGALWLLTLKAVFRSSRHV